MTFEEAAREMLYQSRLSMRAASIKMNRSPSFLFTTLDKGSTPQLDTVCNLANVCGYRVALIPNSEDLPGGAIVLD